MDYEKLKCDRLGEPSASIQMRVRAAMSRLDLSSWGYHRVLTYTCATVAGKLAGTITDLAGSDEIMTVHWAEALQYRPKMTLG